MNSQVSAIIGMYAGGFAVAVLDAIYLAHHGWNIASPNAHPFGLGIMAIISAIGVSCLVGGVFSTIYTIWVDYGFRLVSFVGILTKAAWALAMTAAVAWLVAAELGIKLWR